MADALDFKADFSQLIDELLRVNDALGKFDLKAQNVIDVSSSFNAATGKIQHALNALGPDGQKVVVLFDQIEAAGAKLANIGGPITGALDVVDQAIKRVSATSPVTSKSVDIGALVSLAGSQAALQSGSSGTLTQSNAFSNQLKTVEEAALRAKVPLDSLLNLIDASQTTLAGVTGATRDFANALFNLNQIAQQSRVGDFATQVQGKFSPVTPTGISNQQQADLTAAARQVGEAAQKAGLDVNGLDGILSLSSDILAKTTGEYYKVAQAVLNYREQIAKLTQEQLTSTEAAARLVASQNATANVKTTFFSGGSSGTPEEITKVTTALSAFQREAEKSGLTETELNRVTQDYRNGVVSTDIALSGLNKALAQVEASQRSLGATQAQGVITNNQLVQSQQQALVAAQAISNLKAQFPVPPTASNESIATYAAALSKLQAQIASSSLSATNVRDVFTASLQGSGEVFTGEAGKIQSSINAVISSYTRLTDATGTMSQNVIDFFSRVGSQVTTILINQLYHALLSGVQEAEKFGVAVTKSAAITASTGNNYAEFSTQITNLSNKFGVAREQIAQGLFQTLKHDVGDAVQSVEFLSEATKFSIVTNSNLVDSVQLGTAALNSYNLSANESGRVFAVLFEATKRGRLSVGELANQLGNLGVIASEIGVTIEETAAALDTLTHSGVNAANAQTFLRNFMKALVTPTKEMTEVLESYGFANGKAAVETLGFKGVLQLLTQEANGNITETGKLTSNLRAIQATLGLTGEKMKVFVKTLGDMDNAQQDFSKGAAITFKSTSQIIAEFTEKLSNKAKTFGSFFLDTGASIISFFGGAEKAIARLQIALISFSVTLFVANIGTIGPALVTFVGILQSVTIALATNPFVLAGVAIGLVTAAVISYGNAAQEELKRQKEIIENLKAEIVKNQNELATGVEKVIDAQNKAVNLGVAHIQAAYHSITEIIKDEFEETSTFLKNLFDEDVKHRNETINNLKGEVTKATSEISTLEKEKELGVLSIQDRIFEEKLRTLTIASQIDEREQRSQELIASAIKDNERARGAAAKGQIEDATRLEQISKREFEDASKQLDKVAQATLKIKDLSKGYTSALIDFIKKDFELEVKLINETEKNVLDSFKRVSDAVKDIRDKTGDFSGDSSKFLQGITKQLTTYINQLRGANGRVRINTRNAVDIDPKLERLLDAVDPKTIKKLRFAIETRNQEDVDRILKDLETVQKKMDAIAKARAAYNAEQKTIQLAQAARRNNDFENERKFLKDSIDFAVKSETEGFRSGKQVREDIAGIEARILQTFREEATARGTIKSREEDTYKTLIQQRDIVAKQLELMGKQVEAQEELQKVLGQSAAALEEAKNQRETELASVRTLFEEIDKLRPGRDGIVSTATLNNADKLFERLKGGATEFKFFDPNLLDKELKAVASKVEDLHKLSKAQNTTLLEEARVELEEEGKLRIEAEKAINEQIAKERQRLAIPFAPAINENEKRLGALIQEQKHLLEVGGPDRVLDGERLGPERLEELTRAIKFRTDLLAKLKSPTDPVVASLNATVEKLKNAKPLDFGDAANLDATSLDPNSVNKLLINSKKNSLATFDEIKKKAVEFGLLLDKPFELNIKTEKATGAIETLKEKIDELGDFDVEFKILRAAPAVHKFHGGVVYGPSGIDAVPAMLTAGEVVTDAKNSSRFFGQLMQIRAGQAPSGSSNSVNFGGVNITVNGGQNPQANARAVMDEIRRLQSRGVVEK